MSLIRRIGLAGVPALVGLSLAGCDMDVTPPPSPEPVSYRVDAAVTMSDVYDRLLPSLGDASLRARLEGATGEEARAGALPALGELRRLRASLDAELGANPQAADAADLEAIRLSLDFVLSETPGELKR